MADNVFINGRAAAHKGSMGKSVAFPDVCLCPPAPPSGPIPTPLVNTAQAADLDGCAATVTVEGNRIANAQSFVAKSTGDEVARSTGGGIMTQVTQGKAYFQTFSMNVMIENQPAVRHLDLVTNNHAAKMAGNTPPVPWMSKMLAGPGAAPGEMEKVVGKKKDWITVEVIDQDGQPAHTISYKLTLPDGKQEAARVPHGGRVTIRGIEKGSCSIEFQSLPVMSKPIPGSNRAAQLYKGEPLRLAAGKEHLVQVTVPRVLCMTLPFDPRDPQYAGHTFVLRSEDGSYEERQAVDDDGFADDRKLTLEFANLLPDKQYTLVHHNEAGIIGTIFTDRSYDDIFPPPSRKVLPRRTAPRAEAPAALASSQHRAGRWDDAPLLELGTDEKDSSPDEGDQP